MAKKDFSNKQNPAIIPALQFITARQQTPEEAPEGAPVGMTPQAAEEKSAAAPRKVTPRKAAATPESGGEKENKSKRLNLLLRPSVMEDLQKIATMRRTSVNDLINGALVAFARENRADIEQFDEVFGPKDV